MKIANLFPKNLVGQISLLIIISILLFQAIIILIFHSLDREGRRHQVDQSDFIASAIIALDSVPLERKEHVVSKLKSAAPYANIIIQKDAPPLKENSNFDFAQEIERVNAHLSSLERAYVAQPPKDDDPGVLAVRLLDESYALISIAQHRKPPRSLLGWFLKPGPKLPFFLSPWGRSILFFFISSTIIIIWALNTIVSPLRKLAQYAEKFPNETGPPVSLPEHGSQEVKDLASALNRMQSRIRSMIESRTYALASVSHDLKTMITRLRLRSEFIQNPDIRNKMDRDIEQISHMLEKNLEYLGKGRKADDYHLIDIDSAIQLIVDEFEDSGVKIQFASSEHRVIYGSLFDLRRLFVNLIENALHYTANIEIVIQQAVDQKIYIDVIDDGPGISHENKLKVFEPFIRAEPGRTIGNKTGLGLGLSIVRDIAQQHGGEIQLLDRHPHGLIARVILPRAYAEIVK